MHYQILFRQRVNKILFKKFFIKNFIIFLIYKKLFFNNLFKIIIVSALILMSILVFICIFNFEAIFCVVLSIISISVGTVGYLHLWDVNLDAVSLISMLMSIGFSVDYSAHICYHFYTHSNETHDLKVKIFKNKKLIY